MEVGAHKRAGHANKLRAQIFTEGLNPLSDLQKGTICLLMQDSLICLWTESHFVRESLREDPLGKPSRNSLRITIQEKTLKAYQK